MTDRCDMCGAQTSTRCHIPSELNLCDGCMRKADAMGRDPIMGQNPAWRPLVIRHLIFQGTSFTLTLNGDGQTWHVTPVHGCRREVCDAFLASMSDDMRAIVTMEEV